MSARLGIRSNILSVAEVELLPLSLLASCYGLYFFFLNLVLHTPGGISEQEEWSIFVEGWLAIPGLAFVSSQVVSQIKRRFFDVELFYPVLLAANGLALFVSECGFFVSHPYTFPSRSALLSFAVLFPLINLIAIRSALPIDRALAAHRPRVVEVVYGSLPLMALLAAIPFAGGLAISRDALVVVVPIGFLFGVHRRITARRFAARFPRILDILVVFFLTLLVLDIGFSFDKYHHDFYLGPVTDLMMGKSLLVDINCQYGVVVIYFLAALFQSGLFPFSYQGLSLAISVLYALQYAGLYALSRLLWRSTTVPLVVLVLIVALNFFATMGYAASYPSIGPLRFGLAYLLLFVSMVRITRVRFQGWAFLLEAVILGVASVWSFETFFYVGTTYLAIVGFEGLAGPGPAAWRKRLKEVGARLLGGCAFIATAHAALTLDIYVRSGELPHWQYYLDYIALYSVAGFGTLPIVFWSPWFLMVMVYFGSVSVLSYRVLSRQEPARPELAIVFGMTALGIAQLTYFVGRSHPNNLYHICVPAIFVGAYWATRIFRSTSLPHAFKASLTFSGFAVVIVLLIAALPRIAGKMQTTGAYSAAITVQQWVRGEPLEIAKQFHALTSRSPTTERAAEVLYLLEKYAADEPRVPLFVASDVGTEALMLSRKTNVFPLNDVIQDQLLEPAVRRALDFHHDLQPGEMLFVELGQHALHPISSAIVRNLCRRFNCAREEMTAHGMAAVRLRPQRPARSP